VFPLNLILRDLAITANERSPCLSPTSCCGGRLRGSPPRRPASTLETRSTQTDQTLERRAILRTLHSITRGLVDIAIRNRSIIAVKFQLSAAISHPRPTRRRRTSRPCPAAAQGASTPFRDESREWDLARKLHCRWHIENKPLQSLSAISSVTAKHHAAVCARFAMVTPA